MNKRQFLTAAALGANLPLSAGAARPTTRSGPGLLTVAGALSRSNRGPLDPALDQLMVKHGARFERAWEFDAAMLARLPAVSIRPTLEYDAKTHRLSGPLLSTVLEAAGVATDLAKNALVMLGLRALDGYTVAVSLADAKATRMIVATTLDGAPMSIGGLGPRPLCNPKRGIEMRQRASSPRRGWTRRGRCAACSPRAGRRNPPSSSPTRMARRCGRSISPAHRRC